MAKIYIASSWRNSYQQDVVSFLRNKGHEVYDFRNPPHGNGGFQWSDIDPNWQQWTTEQYREALNHPIAQKGFNSDFNGMQWADVCVMVLPCGRSANTEAGWMKGAGKRVMVYSPKEQEPELMYKIYDFIACSLKEPPSFFHLKSFMGAKDLNLGSFCSILQIQKGKARTHGLPSDIELSRSLTTAVHYWQ